MRTSSLPVWGLPFFVFVTLLLAACAHAQEDPQDKVDFGPFAPLTITHDGKVKYTASVRLADDPVERARGLMFVDEMPKDQGMIFDFGGMQTAHMWMKNTYIPLDMLFLSKTGVIVTIANDAQPRSLRVISSQVPVAAVLELNGGTVQAYGLQRGDQVHHTLFGNAPTASAKASPTTAKEN